jgi:opacity protein-like surface antigen
VKEGVLGFLFFKIKNKNKQGLKMKKLLSLGLLVAINTSVFAGSFMALTYAPTAEGKKLSGYQFDDSNYLKFKYGSIADKPMGIGYYIDLGATMNSGQDDGYGLNTDVKYNYFIANIGPTLNINKNFSIYGGVGVAYQRGEYFANGREMISEDTKTELNINAGAMATYGNFGVLGGYDSAAKAVNFGLVMKF